MRGEAHGDQLTADQPPDNRAKDGNVLALVHVSPSRLERGARFGNGRFQRGAQGGVVIFKRRQRNARLPPPLLGVGNGWARAGPRLESHCLLAAQQPTD
jgi:hypothetical protein